MLSKSNLLLRNIIKSTVRNSHDHGGVPGRNLPFQIENRFRLTLVMILFAGSGFGAPFLILRHQMLKK